jgi:hypothetical protein
MLVNFVSHTVVIGFTVGAPLLIATSQIKNFFDLSIPRGTSFYETIHVFLLTARDINPYATAVGIVTLLCGILVKKLLPKNSLHDRGDGCRQSVRTGVEPHNRTGNNPHTDGRGASARSPTVFASRLFAVRDQFDAL